MSLRVTTFSSGLTRRHFLVGTAGAASTAGLAALGAAAFVGTADADTGDDTGVFLHSVASGDPLPEAVVLWTRVTPAPDATPGSGLGAATTVRWEISTGPDFGSLTASGEVTTDASLDHTVKVDVGGLSPATDYHYRFTVLDGPAAGSVSRTGRTRTAPAPGADPGQLRFAVCSCSNYEAGYFRAYRDLADRDDLEFTLHLGDFTYEYATGEYTAAHGTVVRRVEPAHRTLTLDDFRIRQGHYHRDADLADLLAARPLIATWDDHEFADNIWREGATGDHEHSGAEFQALKESASQAYREWMPVRDGVLQRHLRFGTLAEFIIPDLRSYRDEQAAVTATWTGTDDRTLMGSDQFNWFSDVLTTSDTRWQLIGNQVMFAPLTLPNTLDPRIHDWLVGQIGLPADGLALNADQWDGYMAERRRVIDLIVDTKPDGVVFLTGDIHTSWAADIPVNPGDYRLGRDMRVAATEFIAPSVTAASAFDSIAVSPELDAPVLEALQLGEQIITEVDSWFHYVDLTQHGYLTVDVDTDRVRADWYHGSVLTPDAPVTRTTSYQAVYGAPGVRPVDDGADGV